MKNNLQRNKAVNHKDLKINLKWNRSWKAHTNNSDTPNTYINYDTKILIVLITSIQIINCHKNCKPLMFVQ